MSYSALRQDIAVEAQSALSLPRSQWGVALALVAVSELTVVLLFWNTAHSIEAIWQRSMTFSHGFLVLPISLYLIWRRRKRLSALSARPNLWAIPLVVILAFIWLLGNLASAGVVQQFVLVSLLPAIAWLILGTAIIRALLFPLFFLFFAVPMGESLIPPLQDITTSFTVKAVELSSIPIYSDGRFLVLPSGTWEVAEACSGLRYLIACLAFGSLYASLAYHDWGRRIGFFSLSATVPILANCIRAYGIVMLGHLTNRKLATGVDHIIYGWIFFLVVICLLIQLGERWRRAASQREGRPGEREDAIPVEGVDFSAKRLPLRSMLAAAVCGVVLLIAAPLAAHTFYHPIHATTAWRIAPPTVRPPWRQQENYTGRWIPQFQGVDSEILETYRSGDRTVYLYVGYYGRAHEGEMVSSANALIDRRIWFSISEHKAEVQLNSDRLSVHGITMRSAAGTARLVWNWYRIGDEYTANPYLAKLLEAKSRLLRQEKGGAIVAIGTDYDQSATDAAEILQDFSRHVTFRWSLISEPKNAIATEALLPQASAFGQGSAKTIE